MPFFSIIIPVYNVASYLRECLDSVLAQTFGDWEAICVDDGSIDGSGAILDEYAAKDNRFKVIHQANAGVSAARNTALDVAKGEYIGFVDGDDIVLPKWFENFKRVIARTGCDFVRQRFTEWRDGDAYTFIGNDCNVAWYSENKDAVIIKGLEVVFQDGYSFLSVVKRRLLRDIRFDLRLKMHEDCIFFAYVVCACRSICIGDYAGYLYRKRDNSACDRFNRGDGTEYARVLEAICSFVEHHAEILSRPSIQRSASEILGEAFMSRFNRVVALSYASANNLLSSVTFEKNRAVARRYRLVNLGRFGVLWAFSYWVYFYLGSEFLISMRWRIARFHVFVQKFMRAR